MAAESQGQTETVPGTVFTPRQVSLLKIAVIVMGILLVGAFAVVTGTIVYQASKVGKSASHPSLAVPLAADPALTLKQGQTVAHIALDGDRMAVHVTGPDGAEIHIVDLTSGTVVSRLRVKSE
jgi:hypothetical protein